MFNVFYLLCSICLKCGKSPLLSLSLCGLYIFLSSQAIKSLEEKLTFARDDRLGYLTFCPSNLGTTLRASVHIKIPHLSARKDFKSTCEKLKLQARGITYAEIIHSYTCDHTPHSIHKISLRSLGAFSGEDTGNYDSPIFSIIE